MNYIYDVLLNFNYNLYDFYEWNKNDRIKNIKKIPVFKINSSDYINLKNNKFIINNFVDCLYNKTECFSNKKNNRINYSCVFCSNNDAVAFLFNKKGECIKKSSLLLDELEEVLCYVDDIPYTNVKYKITNDNYKLNFYTRSEVNLKNYLLKKIDSINDINIIHYMYYECAGYFSKDIDKNNLISLLMGDFSKYSRTIYNFLQLFSMNK